MHRAVAVVLALAGLGVLAFLPQFVTEGQFYSTAWREFEIRIVADDEAPWSVSVPTLMPANGSEAEDLMELIDDLAVVEGNASLDAMAHELGISGRGDATLLSRHAEWAMKRGYIWGDWTASGGNATRLDREPVDVRIEWRVAFSGGGGHVCSSNTVWRARLGPGETSPLARSASSDSAIDLRAGADPLQVDCV